MSTKVQELHGCPWKKLTDVLPSQAKPLAVENLSTPPLLSPSSSEDSVMDFGLTTPPRSSNFLNLDAASHIQIQGIGHHFPKQKCESQSHDQLYQNQSPVHHFRLPQFARRPSHDLFECIEQTPDKRLSEDQARYIFGQVVEAAYYLDSQGITHRDIKDENLVIDQDLKVIYIQSIFEAGF
jgi:Protein kinase domain